MKTTLVHRRSCLRHPLTASGILGCVPMYPALLLGGEGQAPPSHRLNLGCIRLEIQGTNNRRTFLGHPEVRVVAVCGVHETQRLQAKKGVDGFYGNADCASYRDFRALMARQDIDAVQITTRDHWHPLIAIEAARRGKHMHQDEPMGWSFHAVHAVQKAVQDSGVVFQFGTRHGPAATSDWRALEGVTDGAFPVAFSWHSFPDAGSAAKHN